MRRIGAADSDTLATLMAEYRALDERICQLGRQRFLTPDEQLEIRTLKKLKLAKKDRIAVLERRDSFDRRGNP